MPEAPRERDCTRVEKRGSGTMMCALALMVGCVAAAAPPALEQQFTSNSSSTIFVDGKMIEKNFFEFHFDVPRQR